MRAYADRLPGKRSGLPSHIEHRPDGDKGAESDHLAKAPVENRGTQGAALTEKADGAGPCYRAAKSRSARSSGAITPKQFGPMIRIDPRAARILRSRSAPLAPVSLKPADMTIAAGTLAAAHSATMPGTVSARVDDDRQIHRIWNRADGRIGVLTQDLDSLRIYRQHPTVE